MWHASLLLGLRHVGAFSSLFPNLLKILQKSSGDNQIKRRKEEKT
jgi:hypothetical protein